MAGACVGMGANGGETPTTTLDVVIRPVGEEDAPAIHAIRCQPSVVRFTTALPSRRVEDTRAFLRSFGADDHVLVAEVQGQVVGMAGLHVREGKQRHSATVGMMVHDAHQGRGIGGVLLDALLDLADSHLGLARVELEVMADNARAIALYESRGFQHEGRKRRAVFRREGYVDILVMGRLREPAPG